MVRMIMVASFVVLSSCGIMIIVSSIRHIFFSFIIIIALAFFIYHAFRRRVKSIISA